VLRSVTLGIAMCLLVPACALIEPPPPPPGTTPVLVNVKNETGVAVEFGVRSGPVELPNGAQPAFLADGATADVTFYLPLGNDWSITVNGNSTVGAQGGMGQMLRQGGCHLDMRLDPDGGVGMGC
jgi:hypothetical protein